jgi:multicomponent Na+:H+ antiporter subunit C
MAEVFFDRYVYFLVLVLLAIGLYGMFALRNLAKKVVGMTIFTTAIYLFFIEGSVIEDGTAPIIDPALGPDVAYVDPLPHLLILTAIVVGVGIVGVALALLVRIYQAHGTFDEDAVVASLSGTAGPPDETSARATRADDGEGEPDGG